MLNNPNQGRPPVPGQMHPSHGEMAPYAPWYNSQGYGTPFEEDDDGINPLALLLYLLKYRWMIAILLGLGLVVGTMVTWMQTPQYRATAQMEIMVPAAKVFQDLELMSQSTDSRLYQTAREKLKSRSLAQRVVFELGLADNVKFIFPAPQFALSNIFARAFGYETSKNLEDFEPEQRERMAVGRLIGNLSVDLIRNTSLLAITYTDQNPLFASQIANQIAASYIDQGVDQTSETSDLARQFMQEQVVQIRQRLQDSEKALVNYAKQEGITVTGSEMSLIAANLQDINNALSKAVQERLDTGRLVQQIEAGRGASLPQVLESSGIQKLNERLAELSGVYQQKRSLLKPDFPEMRQLQAQMTELEKQVGEAVKVVTSSIRISHEEAKAKEADLRTKLAELEADQSAFQDKNIQYTILKRDVDSNRSQYESLIGKLNEVGVGSALKHESTVITDAAVPPGGPFSPRMSINLAIALMLSMVLAAAIVYLLELLNNTFSNPDQIESELKLPVLGILPLVEDANIDQQLGEQQSALSEAYRSLRTSLQFTGTDGNPRSLLVTSSEPSEGKSTTSFKLAQDFASLGLRVLLIDADMRKPNLHAKFGTDNVVGLSNLLTNTVLKGDLKKIFRTTRFPNVTFVSAGTIPPNPPDLLSSPKMARLLQACNERYDIVIFDSPPVIGISDAPILARLVEGTLLVVSAHQVTRKGAAAALKRLKSVGANVFGATLSKFAINKFEYAYAYRYMSEGYYSLSDESGNTAAATAGKNHVHGSNPIETTRARMRRAGDFLRGRLNGD